jgi:hypothetical protein
MKELLQKKKKFSSQELFVVFHIAYAAMCGAEITNLQNTVIYWEPHAVKREDMLCYEHWLSGAAKETRLIRMVRNVCVRVGGLLKDYIRLYNGNVGYATVPLIGGYPNMDWDVLTEENEILVRFEDIKCNPKEELTLLCEQLEIPWSDSLMQTTKNGMADDYENIRDFDLKPVYNGYEEFFSLHDKIRIAILNAPWLKKYGYSYEKISDYSRRELQELFLKKPRFVKEDVYLNSEQELRERIETQKWERDYLQRARRLELLKS